MPARSAVACTGQAVLKTDPAGDAFDPFVTGRVPPGPPMVDLTGFTVKYADEGLAISWQTVEDPRRLPPGRDRIRYLIFGYWEDFWTRGATPYAYLDLSGPAGGLADSFRAGIGEHYPAGPEATYQVTRWVDVVSAPVVPSRVGDSIGAVIPETRLHHDTIGGFFYPQGVTVSGQFSEGETFARGRPTAPVGAAMVPPPFELAQDVPIPGAAQMVWGVADAAPNGRATGTPPTGYGVSYSIDSRDPELCRPDPPPGAGKTRTCRYAWADQVGPVWIAVRIDTTGSPTTAHLQMESTGGQGEAPAAGILSGSGMLPAVVARPAATGDTARLQAGSMTIATPDDADPRDVNIFSTFGPAAFPTAGPAWMFALIPEGRTLLSLSFDASGPNLGCGPAASGADVGFIQPQAFPGSTSASAGSAANGGAIATAGGRLDVEVRSSLLAFFGGRAFGYSGGVGFSSLWERGPDGTMLRAYSHSFKGQDPKFSHQYLLDVGPPGRYEFGVDYGIWTQLVSAPELIWADIAWP